MLDFALTMFVEPALVPLDVPCARPSVEETAQMSVAIVELHEELDASGIVIKYELQVVERLSDRILVLHQSRLIASGTMAEVRRDPAVQAVYAGGGKA